MLVNENLFGEFKHINQTSILSLELTG